MDICDKTKVLYGSEKFAVDDIQRIKKLSNRDTVPVRAYYCSVCSGWHLSSKVNRPNINDLLQKITDLTFELSKQKQENERLKGIIGTLSANGFEKVVAKMKATNKELKERCLRVVSDNARLINENIVLTSKLTK